MKVKERMGCKRSDRSENVKPEVNTRTETISRKESVLRMLTFAELSNVYHKKQRT